MAAAGNDPHWVPSVQFYNHTDFIFKRIRPHWQGRPTKEFIRNFFPFIGAFKPPHCKTMLRKLQHFPTNLNFAAVFFLKSSGQPTPQICINPFRLSSPIFFVKKFFSTYNLRIHPQTNTLCQSPHMVVMIMTQNHDINIPRGNPQLFCVFPDIRAASSVK